MPYLYHVPIYPFTAFSKFIDTALTGVVQTATVNLIAIISPVVFACFVLYVTLIAFRSMYSPDDFPVMDFMYRCIGWVTAISLGLNIEMYNLYIVPLANGLGNDLAGALLPANGDSYSALDKVINDTLNGMAILYNGADGFKQSVYAIAAILIMLIGMGMFTVVSAIAVTTASVAVKVLIAIGPLFIVAAMFPFTRELFKNWVSSHLNFAFLVMLVAFTSNLAVQFMLQMTTTDYTLGSLVQMTICTGLCVGLTYSLPKLAAGLSSGVGINLMAPRPDKWLPTPKSIGGGDKGGEIKPGPASAPPAAAPGGSITHEQK